MRRRLVGHLVPAGSVFAFLAAHRQDSRAARPNELRVGDALHGPQVAGRKTYLFCFIDDHSRAVTGALACTADPAEMTIALTSRAPIGRYMF